MENSVSNLVSSTLDGDHEFEKKIKLFGFDLDPFKNGEKCIKVFDSDKSAYSVHEASANTASVMEGDESVNSSSTTISCGSEKDKQDAKRKISSLGLEEKKHECQYCFKEFANSQALGGHQNAHKKERLKQKKLLLQAKKATINSYLQPSQNNLSFNCHGSTSTPWFYDPSWYGTNHQFTIYQEPQISFCPLVQDYHNVNGSQKWWSPSAHTPFEQDTNMLSLTHAKAVRREENKPANTKLKSSSLVGSKQKCNSLDLHLGLSFHSTIRCSSKSAI